MIPAIDGTINPSVSKLNNIDENFSNFLTLLTTQLQNQDPTEPADTNQLTQQIATLSQVEQQLETNKNLEAMITLFGSTQYNSLVSYIGRQIEAEGDVAELKDGNADFVYYLGADADTVEITIKDSTGAVVYTGSGTQVAGRNVFEWDGNNNNGEAMEEGTYTVEVAAKDATGEDVIARTFITGIVTSIDSAGGAAFLSIGDIAIPLELVTSVRMVEDDTPPDPDPDP